MNGKIKILATSVLIVLTFSLGTTGIFTIGQGAFTNNNYLTLELIYALKLVEPNPKSSDQDISTLNFSTNLDIEALTMNQIKVAKKNIEDVVNRAFMRWQMQKMKSGELKPFTSQPDNESVRALFFQFLSERPDCAERFSQYDRMLSRENQLRMHKRVLELERSFQNINLVVEKGEIVREWNTTRTINGSEYFVMNREYSMEVNGTIQKVVKVMIYNYNGTEIVDPYMNIQREELLWPCYVWVFWPFVFVGWWYTVIPYGYDFYLYLSFTVDEQPWWKGYTYHKTLGSDPISWLSVASVGFSFAGVTSVVAYFSSGTLAAIAAAASTVISVGSVALAAAFVEIHAYAAAVWDNFITTEAYNWAHDPSFGFKEVEYFHNPISPPTGANPPCLDIEPYLTPYYIRVDNWYYKNPWPYSIYPGKYSQLHTTYDNFVVLWGNTFGFDTWVWVGPFPTDYPPPPPT
ncbi:MAG: hypothetical protein ACTSP1_14820 [Candidatus Freyarchaeota archaeon]